MSENLIQLLSEQVSNQIAAGEVVQRPSSVVKELVENAVDAEATSIKVNVRDSGKSLIQVADNGKGMNAVDAQLCFERHATSKITKAEDLFQLQTKGFRGEALASIASVAQVELLTCNNNELNGFKVEVDGGKQLACEEVSTQKGSVFTVKNLFFNIPARRYFLKSDTVELRHIMEEFERIALTHPEIHFVLSHNGQVVHDLPKSNYRQRIIHLFGTKYGDFLIPIEEDTEIVRISGFVGRSEIAKKSRGDQYFFVNQRFIRNPLLNHAVTQAFEQILPTGQFPFFILYLEVPCDTIDVNVNPTKTEVKFQDERSIHAIVHAAVRRGLGKHQAGPSLDFEQEMIPLTQASPEQVRPPQLHVNHDFNPFENSGGTWQSKSRNWMEQFERAGFGFNESEPNEKLISDDENENYLRVFQTMKSYVVAEKEHGLYWYNQNRLHWKIVFDELSSAKQNLTSQVLLFPIEITETKQNITLLSTNISVLESLGYKIEIEGETMFISAAPTDLDESMIIDFIQDFLRSMQDDVHFKSPLDRGIYLLSRRMAVRKGVMLTEPEMRDLLNRFGKLGEDNVAPNGKRIFFVT
ncbi:MAG: DNA mismatch repair endonuclease MutL, partial [Bacteroidota bacterium]